MERTLIDAKLITLNYYPFEGYGRTKELFKKYLDFNPSSKIKLVLGYPFHVERENDDTVIFYTMFEADRIPEEWVRPANLADALIVPTEWCKKVFENSGVRKPIYVVPLGTDEFEVFDSPKGIFTFLHYDYTSFAFRKGGDVVLDIFLQLFGNRQHDAKLILKGRKHGGVTFKQYPNVEYILENYEREEMVELMRRAHCFVFPSRGEGFGLPPIEAMAHGVPTILTKAHSMAEFADLGIPIGITKKRQGIYDGWTVYGNWVEPDPDQLRQAMMRVFENYDAEKKRAVENQKIIKERYDFAKISKKLAETVEKIGEKKYRDTT